MRENSKAYRGLKLPTYRQLKCGHTMNLISKHVADGSGVGAVC